MIAFDRNHPGAAVGQPCRLRPGQFSDPRMLCVGISADGATATCIWDAGRSTGQFPVAALYTSYAELTSCNGRPIAQWEADADGLPFLSWAAPARDPIAPAAPAPLSEVASSPDGVQVLLSDGETHYFHDPASNLGPSPMNMWTSHD